MATLTSQLKLTVLDGVTGPARRISGALTALNNQTRTAMAPMRSTIAQAVAFGGAYAAARPGNLAGCVVLFSSGCYRANNLIMKSRVRLRGVGYGQTQVRRNDAGSGVLLFVPKAATLFGWDNICFDGNNANAPLSSHVIEFEATNSSSGQSFSPAGDKVTQEEYSYKMASCWSFVVINGRVGGVYVNGYNFDVRFMDFRISHCLGHGLYVGATDCLFANGYVEKCGLSGIHCVTGANKFINIKSIFNCRQDATPGSYANVWVGPLGATPLTGIEMYGVEAQDGYGDGFFINTQDGIFSINSNTGLLPVSWTRR